MSGPEPEDVLDAVQIFTRECPDWVLVMGEVAMRAVKVSRGSQAIVINGALPQRSRDDLIMEAIDSIRHPELPHPNVISVDG